MYDTVAAHLATVGTLEIAKIIKFVASSAAEADKAAIPIKYALQAHIVLIVQQIQ